MAACGFPSIGREEKRDDDAPEDDVESYRPKWLRTIGETDGDIKKMIKTVTKICKASKDTQDLLVRLAPSLYPKDDKGDAYKKTVMDLTRIFGSADRAFQMGPEKASLETLKEFKLAREAEARGEEISLLNTKPRADQKATFKKSTVSREDVVKTGVTFDVFPENKRGPKFETTSALKLMDKTKCHGIGDHNSQVVEKFGLGKTNGFITCCLTAWSDHYPLELSPDVFWTLVLMGITTHVEQNSEALRSKFVAFKGKKELVVDNDSLTPYNLQNDWDSSVDDWVELINRNLVTNKLNNQYSTTTRMAQVVQRVCVMDCCKSFFSYKCRTECGFPSVTLRGSKEDWVQLRKDILGAVDELCLDKVKKTWIAALDSVLPKFIECFDKDYSKKVDKHFWDSMIKKGARHGSGGWSWFSGWFNVFYPYLGSGGTNEFCAPYQKTTEYIGGQRRDPNEYMMKSKKKPKNKDRIRIARSVQGPDVGDFPKGQALAPVDWEYLGSSIPVELKAGFFGVAQDPKTEALRPFLNWAVVDKAKDKKRRW